jgi:hypothetical protein
MAARKGALAKSFERVFGARAAFARLRFRPRLGRAGLTLARTPYPYSPNCSGGTNTTVVILNAKGEIVGRSAGPGTNQ